jgi:hypothetical protein
MQIAHIMMGGQENFIKMKAKPIPKALIDNIELRVEDFEITAREKFGFEGFLLKNVLVPYINGKRIGGFKFHQQTHYCDVRYYIRWQYHDYGFNRIVYIMLNKDDPRVIETEDYYYIVDNLKVDHDKDLELQNCKFIVKVDTKKNLQLLTHAENLKKQRKKENNLPPHIIYDHLRGIWSFQRYVSGRKESKAFAILKYGYVGAYLKAIDVYKKRTGDHYIANLNDIDNSLPPDYKTMTEKEFYDKYHKKYADNQNSKRKKQIKPDDQLDLGLSLA